MNREFVAAINQVCHDRQLPKEVVLEAVEAALVSAYRRKFGAVQNISASIDAETGETCIFAEKEVVDSITDDKRQISLADAQKESPEAILGDFVKIDMTPKNFGRIAAQTARQVILQRIREAERDSLFNTYAEREGEIINGTVQSIDSQHVTLSLGKVEAVLPRSEQMPTERYSIGQRLRAYVSEVQKTPRGPLIVVSRTHRNMLLRLLELEVPEIYNGTVEIQAIAREAGYRSKVAVGALQEGVDPVGSCVGMRGVRIQSIVNELNGEKIDVVAWSPDPATLIANGLSPAKVLNVVLEENGGDRTATVVVPDKQLSLAIGKEGQNARLAAKLTNWRIDIKSITEAVTEALQKVKDEDDLRQAVEKDQDILAIAEEILKEKEGPMLSDGELQALSRVVDIVRAAEVSLEKDRAAARLRRVITQALEETEPGVQPPKRDQASDLLSRAEAILTGKDPLDLRTEQETQVMEELATAIEAQVVPTDVEGVLDEAVVSAPAEDTATAISSEEVDVVAEVTVDEPPAGEIVEVVPVEAEIEAQEVPEGEAAESVAEPTVAETILEEPLETDQIEEVEPSQEIKEIKAEPSSPKPEVEEETTELVVEKTVYEAEPTWLEDELDESDDDDDFRRRSSKKKGRGKKRELVFDEDLGEVVSRRRRKPGRSREDWEEYY